MDRKGIAAVSLAVAVLIAWVIFNNKEMARVAAVQAKEKAAQAEVAALTKAAEPVVPDAAAPAVAPVAPTAPAAEEKREELSGPSVDYTFSNLGGGIATARL